MKTILLLSTCLLLFACSTDSPKPEATPDPQQDMTPGDSDNPDHPTPEPEEEPSLINSVTIYGKYQDQTTGELSKPLQEYIFNATTKNGTLVNLYDEFGFFIDTPVFYNASEFSLSMVSREGAIGTGEVGYYPHYKNYQTMSSYSPNEFIPGTGLYYFGDYQNYMISLFNDLSTYDETDYSYEYRLKAYDVVLQESKVIELGRLPEPSFEILQSKNTLYVLYNPIGTASATAFLKVIDLNTFEEIDTVSDISPYGVEMVQDQEGNAYLFFSNQTLFYDIALKTTTTTEAHSVFSVAGSIEDGKQLQQVADNKLYYFVAGPQPGSQFFYPAIYDLQTKEHKFIDINQELTQFMGDQYAWTPYYHTFALDFENKIFLLGVSSNGLSPEFTSHAVFAVSFEGEVLEKLEIPLVPLRIVP